LVTKERERFGQPEIRKDLSGIKRILIVTRL